MGPQVSKEDLQGVLNQINGRFDWFTKEIVRLEKRIAELESRPAPKKTNAKEQEASKEAAA